MQRILFAILLIVTISVSACTGNDSGAEQKAAGKTISVAKKAEWIGFDAGLAKAAKEKKNMIVDFYTDWCHWCKVMDEKTFSDAKVNQKLLDQFVTVRINAENPNQSAAFRGKTYSNVELTRAFGVNGFPSLAFLDDAGEIITIVPGYVPPETFIYILDYIDQGCYKKQMSFEEFMKKKGECDDKTKT
ncbi:thioredoxin fold domain-containing protein [candidate division KSB1 bacterium]|nr:thioredoxin fold domain-containing protein [candidate division KSB1 bacterium]